MCACMDGMRRRPTVRAVTAVRAAPAVQEVILRKRQAYLDQLRKEHAR